MFKNNLTVSTKTLLRFTLVCLLLVAPSLQAQIRSATVTGLVRAPSGAVIVDAEVVVRDTGTNAAYFHKDH